MNWFKNIFSGPKDPQDNTVFLITSGNITITRNGKTHSIGSSHPGYARIVEILKEGRGFSRLDSLLDATVTINRKFNGAVTVNSFGEVWYNGELMNSSLTKRIGEFASQGLPYAPLVKFLENLMQNPSKRSIDELYGFLEHVGLPITSDGCFIAYKGLTEDFKDCYTRKFDNNIGAINEMPRNGVDDDAQRACSYGFHVGTHEYASGFSQGRLVLVKVNPKDAVSVPYDHSCQKLRVCRYEVIAMCERLITEPLYRAPQEPEIEYDRNPYEMGAEAFDNNESRSSNPFDSIEEEMDFDDWDYGWQDSADSWMEDEEEDAEEATGRRRGPGGRFLPSGS